MLRQFVLPAGVTGRIHQHEGDALNLYLRGEPVARGTRYGGHEGVIAATLLPKFVVPCLYVLIKRPLQPADEPKIALA